MLHELLERTATLSDQTKVRRSQSRQESIRAILDVQDALKRALNGEPLRGLPNLAPGAPRPFYGLKIKGRLSLSRDGSLVWLHVQGLGKDWEAIPIGEIDPQGLLAEDLPLITEAVVKALKIHVERTGYVIRGYEDASRLAVVLKRALRAA